MTLVGTAVGLGLLMAFWNVLMAIARVTNWERAIFCTLDQWLALLLLVLLAPK